MQCQEGLHKIITIMQLWERILPALVANRLGHLEGRWITVKGVSEEGLISGRWHTSKTHMLHDLG